MPVAKTPAKAGKQTSISSFFSRPSGGPPSSPAVVPKKRAPSPKPKPKPASRPGKKPAAVEDSDEEDEDVRLPARRRASKRALDDEEEFVPQSTAKNGGDDDDDDDDDLYSVPAPAAKKAKVDWGSSPASATLRKHAGGDVTTSDCYRYNPSLKPAEAVEMDEDPTRKREKERLRQKFAQKLGKIEISRKAVGDAGEEAEADGDEEPEPAPFAKRFGRGRAPAAAARGRKPATKLTPLEKQVVDIKRRYMDTVLIVEVGYKFRFFGEDARIASQNLSIMCIPGKMRFDEHPSEAHMDKFASASIPVHRLHVHVKRLVENGYKVGVVRQLETAALKAAGDNKAGPFERKLTNLYTKGTYVDDIDGLEGDDLSSGAGSGGASNTGFLLCITEKLGGGSGTDEKVHVGLVAVQPSTGEVIYDEFDDGFMRSEIETRLLHIAPCEFVIVGELSKSTEKIVSHLAGSTTTVFGDRVRVERMEKDKHTETDASTHVSKFYADKVHAAETSEAAGKNKLLDAVLDLPGLVTICLSSMIKHLSDYGLEHVFDLTKYFQSFSGRSHMLLNGNTLSSLEIYRNQTDYTTKGSLFWTLDRTKTKFGRRLLRNWVGRPLLDKRQLEERVKAVEEAKRGESPKLEKLKELLAKVSYDLEKGLIRIYYGKCTRPELLSILQTMNRIAAAFPPMANPEDVGFESEILNKAVAALPGIQEDVAKFLDVFDPQAAGKDDKYEFFKYEGEDDEYAGIVEHKMGIAAVEADLQEYKKEIAKILKGKKINYVTVSGIEYLVEVPNTKVALAAVPANWVKISGTQKVHRFHSPKIIQMLRERDQHKESLAAECDKAFKRFLERIASKYQELRDCVQSLAILDCILSLVAVANQPGYVKPEFRSETTIDVKEGRHPMVEQLLLDAYVPNDITLSQNSKRAMLVTGPNMGGKSSYVRQIALISIMAQIGSYVPAASATLGLLDAVFTRMGAFDNMMAGESTFMVELSETSDILKQATPRSLIILDELGRGTSTHDGVAIAHAVFDYIVRDLGALLLFVTHYPLLSRFGEMYPDEVTNTHMAFEENGEGGEDITFLYRVAEGVAHRSYGLNVARLAGLPKKCLNIAAVKSQQLEAEMKERVGVRWAKSVQKVMEDSEVDVEALVRSLEGIEVDV